MGVYLTWAVAAVMLAANARKRKVRKKVVRIPSLQSSAFSLIISREGEKSLKKALYRSVSGKTMSKEAQIAMISGIKTPGRRSRKIWM